MDWHERALSYAPCPPTPPGWLWFARMPWYAAVFIFTGLVVLEMLVGLVPVLGVRGTAAVLIAVTLTVLAYVPFIRIIVTLAGRSRQCALLTPPGYLVFVFAALQLAHAAAYFALFMFDETAFSNVCGSSGPPCTFAQSPLVMLRLVYFSAMTFTSVGYGDIAPQTPLATLLTLPEFWAPVFYLGLLVNRIARDPATASQDPPTQK